MLLEFFTHSDACVGTYKSEMCVLPVGGKFFKRSGYRTVFIVVFQSVRYKIYNNSLYGKCAAEKIFMDYIFAGTFKRYTVFFGFGIHNVSDAVEDFFNVESFFFQHIKTLFHFAYVYNVVYKIEKIIRCSADLFITFAALFGVVIIIIGYIKHAAYSVYGSSYVVTYFSEEVCFCVVCFYGFFCEKLTLGACLFNTFYSFRTAFAFYQLMNGKYCDRKYGIYYHCI